MQELLIALRDHWLAFIVIFVVIHFLIRRSVRKARLDKFLRRQDLR